MSEIEEIKKKIDIVDLVSRHVNLKKAGRNYKATCPFHNEKTPSFIVSPEKQIWHCFGCHKGGDIFSFWQEIEGVEFYDALKSLADKAGVELKNSFKGGDTKASYKKVLYKINSLVAAFYHKILTTHEKAKSATDYLEERGLKSTAIEDFNIGFAPDKVDLLKQFLIKRGFKERAMLDAGVLMEKRGQLIDKFRGRVVFPICDVRGQVLGLMARALDEKAVPKYLNTPDTLIYRKGETVFGLNLARRVIVEKDAVIVVEGNMDVVTAHQAGFKNTVATTGTAFTSDQLNLVKRFTSNLYLAFDNDEAGKTATRRVVEMALPLGLNIKIISLGKYKDPDEMIKADPRGFGAEFEKAVSALDFYFSLAETELDTKSATSQKNVTNGLLDLINLLVNSVEQDHYLNRLSSLVGVPVDILYETLDGLKKKIRLNPQVMSSIPKIEISEAKKLSKEWLTPRLIGLGLFRPKNMPIIIEAFDNLGMADNQFESVFLKIKKCYNGDVLNFSLATLGTSLSHGEHSLLKRLVLIIEEKYGQLSDEEIAREVLFYVDLLKRHHHKSGKIKLLREIESAETVGNLDKVKELTNRLVKLRD